MININRRRRTTMDTICFFVFIFTLLTGQALSAREDIVIYADCHRGEFHLLSNNGTRLASKQVSFHACPNSIHFAQTDRERVYWIEDSRPPSIGYLTIRNGNFQGSANHVDLPSGFVYRSIQFDDITGLVYLIANDSILVKSLQENMGGLLDIPARSKPSLLAIDPHNKLLFWFDDTNRELLRAKMDGSSPRKVFGNFPLNSVRAMTLDIPEKRIYIGINDRMLSATYYGRSKIPVTSSGDSSTKFFSIAVDETKVIYTVKNNPHIMFVNKSLERTHKFGTLFSIRMSPDVVRSVVTSYTVTDKAPNQCSLSNTHTCPGSMCVTKGPNAITCLQGISKDSSVRLSSSGKVELSLEGQWQNICADQFTEDEAIVTCRQLRKYGSVKVLPPQQTSGPLLQIKCPYSTTSLSTCIVTSTGSSCATGAAAVDCRVPDQGLQPSTRKTLRGGTRTSEGRLEVYNQDGWFPVCDPGHFFNYDAANAFCRDLGYQRGTLTSKNFTTESVVDATRQDIKCFLGATSLEYCYTSPWQRMSCASSDVIAVECYPQAPEKSANRATQPSITDTEEQDAGDLSPSTTSGLRSTTSSHGPTRTIRLDGKQLPFEGDTSTDLAVETSTEKRSSHWRIGPIWLVIVIAVVGTAILIVLTISLSIVCYRKRKQQDEPFGIHANPLVQQMSMMEQNELMLKYLEEKRQLGCLSDSRSSLNYNAAGVLLPDSIDGMISRQMSESTTIANHYETIPRASTAKHENAANEHIAALQNGTKATPIWKSPLPDLPPSGNGENQYMEPVPSPVEDNHYYLSMGGDKKEASTDQRDDGNYELPSMPRRKMSIDPRSPVF